MNGRWTAENYDEMDPELEKKKEDDQRYMDMSLTFYTIKNTRLVRQTNMTTMPRKVTKFVVKSDLNIHKHKVFKKSSKFSKSSKFRFFTLKFEIYSLLTYYRK